jgi:hypothetical protein
MKRPIVLALYLNPKLSSPDSLSRSLPVKWVVPGFGEAEPSPKGRLVQVE